MLCDYSNFKTPATHNNIPPTITQMEAVYIRPDLPINSWNSKKVKEMNSLICLQQMRRKIRNTEDSGNMYP